MTTFDISSHLVKYTIVMTIDLNVFRVEAMLLDEVTILLYLSGQTWLVDIYGVGR